MPYLDETGAFTEPMETDRRYLRRDSTWGAPEIECLSSDSTWSVPETSRILDWYCYQPADGSGRHLVIGKPEDGLGSLVATGQLGLDGPPDSSTYQYGEQWLGGWTGPNASAVDVRFNVRLRPTTTHQWFWCFPSVEKIDMTNVDGSDIESMGQTFYNCPKLTQIVNVEHWTLPKCTNVAGMLLFSAGLREIHLDDWNLSNCVATSMFEGCTSLETIYCRNGWSFSDYSWHMFTDCSLLSSKTTGATYNDLDGDQSGINGCASPFEPNGIFTMPD